MAPGATTTAFAPHVHVMVAQTGNLLLRRTTPQSAASTASCRSCQTQTTASHFHSSMAVTLVRPVGQPKWRSPSWTATDNFHFLQLLTGAFATAARRRLRKRAADR